MAQKLRRSEKNCFIVLARFWQAVRDRRNINPWKYWLEAFWTSLALSADLPQGTLFRVTDPTDQPHRPTGLFCMRPEVYTELAALICVFIYFIGIFLSAQDFFLLWRRPTLWWVETSKCQGKIHVSCVTPWGNGDHTWHTWYTTNILCLMQLRSKPPCPTQSWRDKKRITVDTS